MSGRIDLNWQGRDITIERKPKAAPLWGISAPMKPNPALQCRS